MSSTPSIAHSFPPFSFLPPLPLLATAEPENAPIVLAGVLLSLVVIYLASKFGAEIISSDYLGLFSSKNQIQSRF